MHVWSSSRRSTAKICRILFLTASALLFFWMQAWAMLRASFSPSASINNLFQDIRPSRFKHDLNRYDSKTTQRDPDSNAFGACLMVKDDNDLLHEWLAYHYTVLPLGYVVVGSDRGNSQDPEAVLSLWRGMNMTTWVLHSEDFIHRHGNYDAAFGRRPAFANEKERTAYHHHALIHRQKGFITTCAELLKAQGVGWTLMIDTDEFLVLNPMTNDEEANLESSGSLAASTTSIEGRRMIANATKRNQIVSFVNVIQALQKLDNESIGGCYTIPRLLVGALENETCPGVESSQAIAKAIVNGRFSHLSTLRYFQHARKGDFALSKFGKVLLDLSAMNDETVSYQVPANIHRPFKQHCKSAGGIRFADSYFFLLHYIGSWERYAARSDHRRNRDEWASRSTISDDMSACAVEIWRWFPAFARHVGAPTAKYLMGVTPRMAGDSAR